MLLQDIKYALRSLWHAKGFATVAVLCLGFGIGVNTTIFSIIDGVLVKPFPYHDSERLVVVGLVPERAADDDDPTLSYLDLRDWRGAATSFAGFGAEQGRSMTLVDGTGEPARYLGGAVSADMFPVLGIAPALGRNFTPEEDSPAGGGAVIISDNIWRARYQSDPGVLGKVVTVNAVSRVIVGVMPPRFQFPTNMELWIPLAPTAAKEPRASRGLLVFGRLKPGVAIPRALEELRAIALRLKETYPDDHKDAVARISTLRAIFIPPDVTLILWMMMAGVTLVLFIACSNVANLLLARATARRRELSVRAALGAGRGRIIRQLLTESVVLAIVSVPLGIALAHAGTKLIASAMPVDQVPYYIRWEVDWRALAYTFAVAAGTALLFGLFPALQASRGQLHEQLKEGTRGNSASRSILRSTLVVVQIALALVSLAGALLFVRSFRNLDGYQFGFDPKPLMTMRVYLPGEVYDAKDAKARRVQDILSRVEAIPGVQAAFASNLVPLSGGGGGGGVIVDGRAVEPGREPFVSFAGVTPHFLQTLGLSVRRGRNFTDAETAPGVIAPVSIINETMAKQLWPGSDALGGRFKMVDNPNAPDWFTVVGIVPDFRQYAVNPGDQDESPAAYVSYSYQQTLSTGLTIRVARDPASITSAARAAIRESDPNVPVALVRTMDEVRRLGFWQFELFGWIFGTIGVVGLTLASVGVYGVMSYAVSQRTQEIGVRIALGAGRADVLRLVVGQGLTLAGIGIAAGLVLGPLATSFARTQLYGISPFDPLSFATVALVLLTVAFVASYMPARRAMAVDPVVALRGE
jgi:putative ABC transport system permease protein